MGKKKFFDKKKSATFQLMARDTSDPNYSTSDPMGDRVFVRVDNNEYVPTTMEDSADPDSIYADAPDDYDDEDPYGSSGEVVDHKSKSTGLPDHIRREILELGFPDDGYNYLAHMREIKNTGGGSTYFNNPKADVHQLPQDVKAYDASRVEVSNVSDTVEKSIYSVAAKTVDVRLHKALDPEIAALLDDRNSSDFGSDVEDLEEDFVVKANLFEGSVGQEVDEKFIGEELDEKLSFTSGSRFNHPGVQDTIVSGSTENRSSSYLDNERPRVRRPLDEQFDMLELQEYGSDNEEEFMGYMDEEDCQESLKEKLSNALEGHPSNVLHHNNEGLDDEPPELTAEVIRRCREYAEKFEDQDDQEVVLVEESSDEAEAWDCETIVTTYSTLDNHPAKIGAPEGRRKKKIAEALSGSATGTSQVITLRGRERLPVDFLPANRKRVEEKTKDEKDVNNKKSDLHKKKPRAQESKEEKKERKSAVKLERREARQLKKETKEVYKFESHRAQKVAAFTGPSSIHLM
ncbi:protein LTV1 homolog [Salvia hispanica]|uniref:protein LTV1 homolog n=1 Tax=Salvia hispanica TaxID=49212 RepID=UPI002008FF12|nr:protein LTV1 homolog [Salvia hispanica]